MALVRRGHGFRTRCRIVCQPTSVLSYWGDLSLLAGLNFAINFNSLGKGFAIEGLQANVYLNRMLALSKTLAERLLGKSSQCILGD